MHVNILIGDVVDLLADMAPDTFDGVVTDPPYGLGVERWDDPGRVRSYKSRSPGGYGNKGRMRGYGRGGTPQDREAFRRRSNREFHAQVEAWSAQVLRVCKPGAHLLAFGASRTGHRLVSGIEDAGWEIRDTIVWEHDGGVPKSRTTELRPKHDVIVLARKPLSESTVPKNVARWGVGDLRTEGERHPTNLIALPRAPSAERLDAAHPHVKPIALCTWLARLVLPACGHGRLLVPFCGSGSEMIGAIAAGWTDVIGIERDPGHAKTSERRIREWATTG